MRGWGIGVRVGKGSESGRGTTGGEGGRVSLEKQNSIWSMENT